MALSFNDSITRLARQKQAVSGRNPSRNAAAGVAEGVAAGASQRLANKKQIGLQEQSLGLEAQRLAQQKEQSDTEIQMAHNAAAQDEKAQSNQTLSTVGSAASSLAMMKYMAASKAGAGLGAGSVPISTVPASGGTAAGAGSVPISTTAASGGGPAGGASGSMTTAAPVAFAAYAAIMAGMSIAASRQSHARRAANQQVDAAGGQTDNPEQNRIYAERRQQEYTEMNRRMLEAYPGASAAPLPNDYSAVGPVDMGRNRRLYGTDYEPPPEYREEIKRRWAAEQQRQMQSF